MRKLLIILPLLLSLTFVSAQEYHPLLEEGKSWNEFYSSMYCIQSPCDGELLKIEGDTIIDSLNYKILKSARILHCVVPYIVPPCEISNYGIFGFLREDTIEQKVYFRENINTDEKLLYDFSLNVGDSISYHYYGMNRKFVLESITDYTLLNGETRRKFNFTPYLCENYYIEGIGGRAGLIPWFYECFESDAELGCVKNNNEPIYQSPDRGSFLCYISQEEFAERHPAPTNFDLTLSYIMLNDGGFCNGEYISGPAYCYNFSWSPPDLSNADWGIWRYNLYCEDTIIATITDTTYSTEGAFIGRMYVKAVYTIYTGVETDSSNNVVVTDLPISIEEITPTKIVTQNPAQNNLTLSLQEPSDISIFDITGKQVYSQTNLQPGRSTIDLSRCMRGLYFLQVTSESGTETFKIVKQ